MCAAMDWPSWINALTVVVLAAITLWYATTARPTLRHLQLERDDRLKTIRQPYTNIIDVCEQLATDSERLVGARGLRPEHADIPAGWSRFHDGSRDTIFDVRQRSELVYRALMPLRDAAQRMEHGTRAVIGALQNPGRPVAHRAEMTAELSSLRRQIFEARTAVEAFW